MVKHGHGVPDSAAARGHVVFGASKSQARMEHKRSVEGGQIQFFFFETPSFFYMIFLKRTGSFDGDCSEKKLY